MFPFMELQPADFCKEQLPPREGECRPIAEGVCTYDPRMADTIKLVAVEFVQENIQYGEEVDGFNFMDFLNNPHEYKYLEPPYGYNVYSLNAIPSWFEKQSKKYGADLSVNQDIIGPIEVDSNPPKRGFYDACSSLRPYFEEQLELNNIDLSGYDGISFIYIHDGDEFFIACADVDYSYIDMHAVENYNVQTEEVITTVTHETAHLFSATDKYTKRPCLVPDGIPEPDKDPLFPQTKGCLMCGFIQTDEVNKRVPNDIEQLVICDKTAAEIGWIPWE